MRSPHRVVRHVEPADGQISRDRMVHGLTAAGITDSRVLEVMRRVPRHAFVPETLSSQAYQNATLPIGFKQTMTQPLTVAQMLQALALRGDERILEIGTGTGYQTALLASLGRAVFSVERVAGLARSAQSRLRSLGIINVSIKNFDGTYGWSEFAPYDAILVSALAPAIPPPLIEQLALTGRIVIPLCRDGREEISFARRKAGGGLEVQAVCPCTFVRLIGRFGYANG
jgi:protein-L-isoaspartate(D-aspartate) O-methyltransferase